MSLPAGDFTALTGVRSGKRSYYSAFRRSSERLEGAVRSLDQISLTLVRTAEGPRALLTAVVQATAEHLGARWVVFALADGALPEQRPRYLTVDRDGRLVDDERLLAAQPREWLRQLRSGPLLAARAAEVSGDGVVVVPMTIDGEPVGGLATRPGPEHDAEPLDLAVLRILVNQAAVALHSASQYHSRVALQTRTEQLAREATERARDLAARDVELSSAQDLLDAARQREILDGERHRIARELHDSVTQHVLSAGMMVEVCRAELEQLGPDQAAVTARLGEVKGLTQRAVGQLRAAIYSLHHTEEGQPLLPRLLEQACTLRASGTLAVDLRLEGPPKVLPAATEESLARLAGEAMFNTAVHSGGSRCVVRLSYLPDGVRITVDDDGTGDPAAMRSLLRVRQACDTDGCGRGLVNMAARAAELGGTFAIRRSRLGGVRLQVQVPA